MKTRRLIRLVAALTVLAAGVAQATLYTYNFTGINALIPDDSAAGWSDTRTISAGDFTGPGVTSEIVDVNVRLNISGGYNGDLYGYLVHSSGFAVLLNRSGRTGSDAFGYGDSGFNITLDDQAAVTTDIHSYQSVDGYSLTDGASWRPDGRNVNPTTVTGGGTRDALLGSFNSVEASGTWTLFLADLGGGETSRLVSWGLDIEVVPEPTTWALIIFAGLAGALGLGRWAQRRLLKAREFQV